MTVKIYGLQMSTCTRRALMVAEELGVAYELVTVDLFKGENKKPEYLEKQPFGKIPVLEDGDLQMFESRAISRYLAKSSSTGTNLLPSDPKTLAVVDSWMEVEQAYYNGPASTIVAQLVFSKMRGGQPDQAVVDKALEEFNKVLDVYEARLSKQPYLAGSEFTLADLFHLPYTQYLVVDAGVTQPFDAHPSVKAWWERCSSRPAWKKITSSA